MNSKGKSNLQGGYGVKLDINASMPATATIQQVADALGMRQSSSGNGAPGSNGQCTDPAFRDTDDGIPDLQETDTGTKAACFGTDWDGLSDGRSGLPG